MLEILIISKGKKVDKGKNVKVKSPVTGPVWPRGFQEV
jgi:hypothetical protein